MEGKTSKVGKLYGGPAFATGPGKNKPADYQKAQGHNAKGTFATGPAPVDMAGHKAKGSFASGTKGDASGEDSAGQASGRSGKVKGY